MMRDRGAVAVLLLAGMAAGCNGGGRSSDDQQAGTTGDAAHTTAQTAIGAPLTDPGIALLVGQIHSSEIGAAQAAMGKLQDARVRELATAMIAEHEALRAELEALRVKASQAPQPPPQWSTMDAVSKSNAQLLALMPAGPAFDRTYVTLQVVAYSTALDSLRVWQGLATDADLKACVGGAIPKVQTHLERARTLLGALGGGSEAAAVLPPPPDTAWYKGGGAAPVPPGPKSNAEPLVGDNPAVTPPPAKPQPPAAALRHPALPRKQPQAHDTVVHRPPARP
ncbi:MAG: hypothetical protein JWM27_995 [Gemmatimonadetes bacterium]|nr:hypothetical protein [Gemmatimonadota bacterium]